MTNDPKRIVLGTSALAGLYQRVSSVQAEATLRAAWDIGIRQFDTAPHYGEGLAEFRLGTFLTGLGSRADGQGLWLSTKVGRFLASDARQIREEAKEFQDSETGLRRIRDYSKAGVMRSVEDSRARLGADALDLVMVHDPQSEMQQVLDEALPVLYCLKEAGVVRSVGLGMSDVDGLLYIISRAHVDTVMVAGRCTLLDRRAVAHLLPMCEHLGVQVLLAGMFNSGLLANPVQDANFDYRPATDKVLRAAQEMRERCIRYGVDLKAAALQQAWRHSAVSAVVIGPRSPHELKEDLRCLKQLVPEPLWAELDDLAIYR
jgi:D-threo-aldose 1-dehydrogenase